MGFRVLLVAVSGKKPAAIYKDCGVVATQEFEEISESPVTGVELSDGSYLLYINDPDLIYPNDDFLSRLSNNAELLACYVNETYMESMATSWANGRGNWFVHHNTQQGQEHLATSGTLPQQFQAIRDRLFAKQQGDNGVDYIFEIPVELVRELSGIVHDRDIEKAQGKPFQVLRRLQDGPRRGPSD